jgi:hypothetical protein
MALAMNKIILANATTNTAGAYFSNVSLTAANAGTVIPAGTYLIFPSANVVITANNGSAITTLLANATGGMILSDGVNVFAQSTIAGAGTATALTINGGISANSTYTS